MLTAYSAKDRKTTEPVFSDKMAPYFWVSLFKPTQGEIKIVEDYYGIKIPTHDQFFSQKSSDYFMALPLKDGKSIDFILNDSRLITIDTYNDSPYNPETVTTAADAFLFVVETVAEDIRVDLSKLERQMVEQSSLIKKYINCEIKNRTQQTLEQKKTTMELTAIDTCVAENHNSLLNLELLINFAKKCNVQIQDYTTKNVEILADYASFLNDNLTYLKDTVFGYIDIAQYNIQSSASLILSLFVIPSLVAGFYSMDFPYVPAMKLDYGVFVAIFGALLGSLFLFKYLRRLQYA